MAGTVVAHYVRPDGLDSTLSPRPFLHPVTTLAGTVVTDALPADHRWHLGLGVAIADVGGVNLWGGRTYVRDVGYTWLDDHGRVEQRALLERSPSAVTAELAWLGPDARPLLHELREMAAEPVPAAVLPQAWRLRFRFTLRNVTLAPLSLGSPGSNGREGGGYGGFFWRLAPFTRIAVRTPDATGETQVHGRPAPWLAVQGQVGADRTEVTLVFVGADERTRRDPWFVRLAGYPGVGSSLAPHRPVLLEPGDSLTRGIDVLVADGAPDADRLTAAVDRGAPSWT